MGIRFASTPGPQARKPAKKTPPVIATEPTIEKRGRGRPLSGKETVTIRISSDVLAHYRATGDGWQARLDATLRTALKL